MGIRCRMWMGICLGMRVIRAVIRGVVRGLVRRGVMGLVKVGRRRVRVRRKVGVVRVVTRGVIGRGCRRNWRRRWMWRMC